MDIQRVACAFISCIVSITAKNYTANSRVSSAGIGYRYRIVCSITGIIHPATDNMTLNRTAINSNNITYSVIILAPGSKNIILICDCTTIDDYCIIVGSTIITIPAFNTIIYNATIDNYCIVNSITMSSITASTCTFDSTAVYCYFITINSIHTVTAITTANNISFYSNIADNYIIEFNCSF